MKKLLMMAAIAALSSSVWAAETYTYSLSVYAFPHESVKDVSGTDIKGLPSDTVMKLVAKDTGDVLVTLTMSDLSDPQLDTDGTYRGSAKDVEPNGEVQSYFTVSWSVGSDNVTKEGYYLHMTIADVKFPDGTYSSYINDLVPDKNPVVPERTENYIRNLEVVLSSESAGLSQRARISLTSSSAVASEFIFAPVPEPTSGLLLLLGVAGLALKRKRV